MVVAMLVVLHFIAPFSEWQDAFTRAEPLWLLAAIGLVLPHEIIKVLRMEQLLPIVAPHRIFHTKITCGMSCVAELPVGTLGGDFYRVIRLEECGAAPEDATAATFLMRIIAFTMTISLAGLGGVIVLGSAFPLLGPVIGALILLLLATSKNPPGFLTRLVDRADDTPRGAWGRFLSLSARLLRHVFRAGADLHRRQIGIILAYTLAIYIVRGAIVWFSLLSLDLDVSYIAALASLAVGNLASSIPSPAGNVGLREGGMIGVLAGFGVAVAPAAIGALLFRGVMIIGSGLGLLLSMMVCRILNKNPC